MARLTLLLTLLLTLVLTGVGCGDSVPPVSDRVTELFGGASAIETINSPTTVRAFRLPKNSYFQKTLADYEMASGPVDVSTDAAAEIVTLLMKDGSYEWDSAKGCEMDFGVRLQFEKDDTLVDILLCYDCRILAIYLDGESAGAEDFDAIETQLVRFAKTVFPDDEAIQALEG